MEGMSNTARRRQYKSAIDRQDDTNETKDQQVRKSGYCRWTSGLKKRLAECLEWETDDALRNLVKTDEGMR